MKGNFEWFLEHYNEVYSLYGECHVIIKDKRIIKLFDNEIEAYHWLVDNKLLGKATIQYCNGDESGYTAHIFTPFIS